MFHLHSALKSPQKHSPVIFPNYSNYLINLILIDFTCHQGANWKVPRPYVWGGTPGVSFAWKLAWQQHCGLFTPAHFPITHLPSLMLLPMSETSLTPENKLPSLQRPRVIQQNTLLRQHLEGHLGCWSPRDFPSAILQDRSDLKTL